VVVAAAALTGLMRYQNSAWIQGTTASLFPARKQGRTEPALAGADYEMRLPMASSTATRFA
jgi:hypothetical protein